MHTSSLFSLRSFLLSTAILTGMAAQAKTPPLGPVSAPLSIEVTTAIPGHILKPGSYLLRVVDHLPDRCILRVEDSHGHFLATFIGLLNAGYISADGVGAVAWSKGPEKTPTLRGFAFSNGLTVEFVYPKTEAVELAKLNASSVPAIDPESEGRPSNAKLSDEDRQIVTLWTLTSTRVGPGEGQPAIEAKRYKIAPDTQLAENTVPPRPVALKSVAVSPGAASATPTLADDAAAQRVGRSDSKMKGRTLVTKLPQTASNLPLAWLLSGLCLVLGVGFNTGRRLQQRP